MFPNTLWMHGGAVQRGTTKKYNIIYLYINIFTRLEGEGRRKCQGDPTTPGWPSVDHAYRVGETEWKHCLPSIPVQPVGYTDAWQLLSRLEGERAPDTWQGGLNFTYRWPYHHTEYCKYFILARLGGNIVQGVNYSIEVHNKQEQKTTSNVVGVIWGEEEPDRYVGPRPRPRPQPCPGDAGEPQGRLELRSSGPQQRDRTNDRGSPRIVR